MKSNFMQNTPFSDKNLSDTKRITFETAAFMIAINPFLHRTTN